MQHDVSAILAGLTTTAEGTAREHAVAVDRDRTFPRATIDALANGGALGLMVPEACGGAGGGLGSLAEACATLGAECASSAMVLLMHSVTAATVAGRSTAVGAGRRAPGAVRVSAPRRTARR